ncbi:hypothetical protein HPB47_008709 [Ixodes persulcatus]|uniref:Uncharacterized protein n=1 Tax=Ixodes persulcatus TaxID=34615 RepID=A0AC60P430_IXOPE|nr:hypothetical protein HPB47_008709 [Ixodes persulcatus]
MAPLIASTPDDPVLLRGRSGVGRCRRCSSCCLRCVLAGPAPEGSPLDGGCCSDAIQWLGEKAARREPNSRSRSTPQRHDHVIVSEARQLLSCPAAPMPVPRGEQRSACRVADGAIDGRARARSGEEVKMAAASAPPAAPTPSRRRFTVAEDIILLQEVVARNPLRNADHWNDVMDTLCAASQRDFSLRGTRERCDLLLGYFHQNDDVNLRKCSTEEQYRKKLQLIKAVAALAQECGYRPKVLPRKAHPARRASVRGFLPAAAPPPTPAGGTSTASDLRDVATVNASAAGTVESSVDLESAKSTLFASKRSYSPTVSSSEGQPSGDRDKTPEPNAGPSSEKTAEEINLQWTPPSQRKRRQDRSGIEYIRKRFLWDVEMRQKELALEARRLALDARRLELEEKRFKFEERRLADEIQARAQERREREDEKHTRLEQMRLLLEQQEINIQLLIKETNK